MAARFAFTPTSRKLIQSLPLPGFSKQPERVAVARHRAADHSEDVFVAIVIDVGERHAVPFVQLAGAGGSGDVHEYLPALVVQQHVGKQRGVRRISGAEIDVQDIRRYPRRRNSPPSA